MKNKLLFCLALLSSSVGAQTSVDNYRADGMANGITYCLPFTRLVVKINATRVSTTPGDFSDYAERYLRLKNVTKEKTTIWNINKVEVFPVGVPDTSKFYTIELKAKTSAPLVKLSKDGIILAINGEAKEDNALNMQNNSRVESTKLNSRNYLTEEILSAGSTTKMAELTASEIYDIRENKGLLAKGQADFMPKDGEQLKLMLSELDKQEEALLQLFKGYEETENTSFWVTFDAKEDCDRALLCRFSKYMGLVDKDDLSGEPVYIDVHDQNTTPAEALEVDAKAKKKIPADVRYNIPGRVAIKIYSAAQVLSSEVLPMGQFGNVEYLGGDLFNKKNTTKVFFYQTTGGIKNIEAEQPQ